MFVVTSGGEQLTALVAYFYDQVLAKRRLLPITADSGILFLIRGDCMWS